MRYTQFQRLEQTGPPDFFRPRCLETALAQQIDTQVGRFMQWMQLREGVPLIRALREEADAARRAELEQALKALARGEPPAQVLESLSRSLTNKLLHGPTQALKRK